MVDAEDFLPGFGRGSPHFCQCPYVQSFSLRTVIKGFKERIYPTDVSDLGSTRPWETIRLALQTLAHELARSRPVGENINVWFTGHSRELPLEMLRCLHTDHYLVSRMCIGNAGIFTSYLSTG